MDIKYIHLNYVSYLNNCSSLNAYEIEGNYTFEFKPEITLLRPWIAKLDKLYICFLGKKQVYSSYIIQ